MKQKDNSSDNCVEACNMPQFIPGQILSTKVGVTASKINKACVEVPASSQTGTIRGQN